MAYCKYRRLHGQDLVPILNLSGYMLYMNSDFHVWIHVVSGTYRVTIGRDVESVLSDNLNEEQLKSFFED